MSNYSNCRDSYAQYHHLSQSHHILYNEWMDDEILPTPDQIAGKGQETKQDNPQQFNSSISTKYWDFFNDDEDWEIFNKSNLTIESNGNLIFNKVISNDHTAANINKDNRNSSSMDGSSSQRDNQIDDSTNRETDPIINDEMNNIDESDKDIVVGSVFDARTLDAIKKKVNGWDNSFPQFHI